MVEKMGGRLFVQSEFGVGSTFTIQFFNILSHDTLHQIQTPLPKVKLPDFGNKTILIVDDLTVNRNLLVGLLEETSATMLEAANGLEALQLIEKNSVDLILMDIRMPIMDGFEATERIKQNPSFAHIPIIAVTASVMDSDLDRITQKSFNGYIMKPVQMWELYDILNNILN
jgi:CheY-like chemotaxis protein